MAGATQRWLSRREVAEVRGVSVDTVKRDEKRGTYRRTRPRPGDPNATVEIAYADLVAAGHVPPPDPDRDDPRPNVDAEAGEDREGRADLEVRLARAEAERDALADALTHARGEAEALRELLRAAVGAAPGKAA